MALEASAPPPSIDQDIAAFIAAGDATGDIAPGGDPAPDDGATPAAGDEPAAATTETPAVAQAAKPAAPVVSAALTAAIEKSDPAAFIAALGDKADALLGSGAHKVLRLQCKELRDLTKGAQLAVQNTTNLRKQLEEHYSDPIKIREAAVKGDADTFVDGLERFAGTSWLEIQKFVAAAQAGRPARLEAKAAGEKAAATANAANQAKASEEAKTWVAAGVLKVAPELAKETALDINALVMAEMKAGWSRGINSPAKALPTVREKLKAQYEALGRIFGKGGKPATPPATPSPSTRVAGDPQVKTRPMTLDEEITTFAKENRW